MSATSLAARRYADALVESISGLPTEEQKQVQDQLTAFGEAIDKVFDLRNIVLNPTYSTDERTKVLDAVMEQYKLHDKVRRFVRLVNHRNRMTELSGIAEAFAALAAEREGKLNAEVVSATELSEPAAEQIRRALEKRTGKKVGISFSVDKSLIGGVRAQVGSMVFDGTIKAELDRLRSTLS